MDILIAILVIIACVFVIAVKLAVLFAVFSATWFVVCLALGISFSFEVPGAITVALIALSIVRHVLNAGINEVNINL